MRAVHSAALAVPLLASSTGHAEELRSGVRFSTGYDSNVFADEAEEEDAVLFRTRPWLELGRHEGERTWRVRYEPSVQYYLTPDIDTSLDHYVTGEGSWELTPKTRLTVLDSFSVTQNVDQEVPGTTGTPSATEDRQRFKSNSVALQLTQTLNARNALLFGFDHFLEDYSQQDSTDSHTLRFSSTYQTQFDARNLMGITARLQRQMLERGGAEPDAETDSYNVAGLWQHSFDETLSLRFSAGPAWLLGSQNEPFGGNEGGLNQAPVTPPFTIEGQQGVFRGYFDVNTCPVVETPTGPERVFADATRERSCEVITDANGNVEPFPSNGVSQVQFWPRAEVDVENSDRVTFFAAVELEKIWDLWRFRLGYTRQDSPSSGLETSTVDDTVTADVVWTPTPRWTVAFSASANHQSQATGARFVGYRARVETASCIDPPQCTQSTAPVPPDGATSAVITNGAGVPLMLPPDAVVFAGFVPLESGDTDGAVVDVRFGMRVAYRLRRNLELFVTGSWLDRSTLGDADLFYREYDRFRTFVGVGYDFDPIHLF